LSQQLDKDTEKNIIVDLKEGVLRSHLDIFILSNIRNYGALSGYDLLNRFRGRFGVNISVGTIYSQLYSLERKQLIEGKTDSTARRYVLTPKGATSLDIAVALKQQILDLVDSLFP